MKRYKVIADYPGNKLPVGFIFELTEKEQREQIAPENRQDYAIHDGICWHEDFFKEYPHLFKELAWYEEKTPEELPYFLKRDGHVFAVDKWVAPGAAWLGLQSSELYLKLYGHRIPIVKNLKPATVEEYNAYITQ